MGLHLGHLAFDFNLIGLSDEAFDHCSAILNGFEDKRFLKNGIANQKLLQSLQERGIQSLSGLVRLGN